MAKLKFGDSFWSDDGFVFHKFPPVWRPLQHVFTLKHGVVQILIYLWNNKNNNHSISGEDTIANAPTS